MCIQKFHSLFCFVGVNGDWPCVQSTSRVGFGLPSVLTDFAKVQWKHPAPTWFVMPRDKMYLAVHAQDSTLVSCLQHSYRSGKEVVRMR
jgi:hypothetical protein